MLAHGAGLLQQLVDQRGFAMINMGDDGDISKGIYHKEIFSISQTALPEPVFLADKGE
jgi:hypothetical protein